MVPKGPLNIFNASGILRFPSLLTYFPCHEVLSLEGKLPRTGVQKADRIWQQGCGNIFLPQTPNPRQRTNFEPIWEDVCQNSETGRNHKEIWTQVCCFRAQETVERCPSLPSLTCSGSSNSGFLEGKRDVLGGVPGLHRAQSPSLK